MCVPLWTSSVLLVRQFSSSLFYITFYLCSFFWDENLLWQKIDHLFTQIAAKLQLFFLAPDRENGSFKRALFRTSCFWWFYTIRLYKDHCMIKCMEIFLIWRGAFNCLLLIIHVLLRFSLYSYYSCMALVVSILHVIEDKRRNLNRLNILCWYFNPCEVSRQGHSYWLLTTKFLLTFNYILGNWKYFLLLSCGTQLISVGFLRIQRSFGFFFSGGMSHNFLKILNEASCSVTVNM